MEFKQFTHNFLLAALLLGMLALPISSLAVLKYNNNANKALVLSAKDSKKDASLSERLPGFFVQHDESFVEYSENIVVLESSEASEVTSTEDQVVEFEEFVVDSVENLN